MAWEKGERPDALSAKERQLVSSRGGETRAGCGSPGVMESVSVRASCRERVREGLSRLLVRGSFMAGWLASLGRHRKAWRLGKERMVDQDKQCERINSTAQAILWQRVSGRGRWAAARRLRRAACPCHLHTGPRPMRPCWRPGTAAGCPSCRSGCCSPLHKGGEGPM